MTTTVSLRVLLPLLLPLLLLPGWLRMAGATPQLMYPSLSK
jgi:hypothetical protein